jgi:ESCRT-I complex subunit MVB12
LKTHDSDQDADLWRDNSILFGKRTSRYLAISKDQNVSEQVISELKVIDKVETGWNSLSKTIDSDQKAWKKRNQIVYKVSNQNYEVFILDYFIISTKFQLSQRETLSHAITDIILCSKLRRPPEGFKLAG